MAYLPIALAYIAVYAVIGALLGGGATVRPLFGNIFLVLPAIATCAVILWRRRRWACCHRLFWDAFGIGLALWVIGHFGWAYETYVRKQHAWVQWHTLFSLCGGIGPLIALFARPHRGARPYALAKVSFLLAAYGLLAVFIYAYFVLIPPLVPGAGNAEVTLLQLVQANRALLFVSMTAVMVMARRTAWFEAYRWMAIGTGAGFLLRIFTSLAIARGDYQSGTLYDLAWIVPFLSYLGAVLAAPDSPAPSEAEVPVRPLHAVLDSR